MPSFVIIGSCKNQPYTVLAMPNKLDEDLYEKDHEMAYVEACRYFYPAIDHADFVIVWAPDGIGEHSARDMEYAIFKEKPIVVLPRDAGLADRILSYVDTLGQAEGAMMKVEDITRILLRLVEGNER